MSVKRIKRGFLVYCLVCMITGIPAFAQSVNTVVLDAGHGGHDTGALGRQSREKDITLAIVLRLRKYILEEMKDVKVILTRDRDEFIELHRRARIANESKADVFISVHCNANPSSAPYGTETYVMGLHKSSANLAVAKAENSAILLEEDYVEKYDGFDPNSPEGTIFFSMMQNAFLDNSLDLAGRIQKQFKLKLNLLDRGVKQAGFLVLYKTAMPGVLIETGFISNRKEESYLVSEKGQDQIALAIFRALREYKYSLEKRDLSAIPEPVQSDSIKPVHIADAPEAAVPAQSQLTKPMDEDKVKYRIQFASSPADKPVDSPEFSLLSDIRKYYHNGLYKFTSGNFDTFREASSYRTEVVRKGFSDAFIIPFYREKRITIEEARLLEGK